MKISNLKDMKKGWFVGNFFPTLIKTNDVEVAVKVYEKGEIESKHYHKISTEITVVVSGKIKMNNVIYHKGDIVVIEPNEATDFTALEDTVCTVVKHPGANNDKYFGEVSQ
jgi:quercetin dioxygenase-like cupin family protein